MIVIAIFGTLAAICWSVVVVFANGMSDAPMEGFKGGWSVGVAWALVAVLWLAWWWSR